MSYFRVWIFPSFKSIDRFLTKAVFTAFFIDGYGAAGNVLGGRLLGAQDFKSLWLLTKRVNTYNLIVCGALMLLGFIFYNHAGLIFSKEEEVLVAFYSIFFIVLLMQPLNSIAFTLDSIFEKSMRV